MKVPYYMGDLKGEPNLENYPSGTLPETVAKVLSKKASTLGLGFRA